MRVVIKQRRRRILEGIERAPSDAVMRHVIEHFLYAPRGSHDAAEMSSLTQSVDELPKLDAAEELTADDWIALATKYILDRPAAAVVGVPQAALAKEIADGVKQRQVCTPYFLLPHSLLPHSLLPTPSLPTPSLPTGSQEGGAGR